MRGTPQLLTATPTSLIFDEPYDVYRAQACDYLSSHALADFRRSPLLYHRKSLGLIADEDRPAFQLGRAAHALILEGSRAFQQRFVVGGPINPRTGQPFGVQTKAFSEWSSNQDKEVLGQAQYDQVCEMAASVRSHTEASQLLTDGHAEVVVRHDYCSKSCQIRMDWFDPHVGIVDLKTIDSLDFFEIDAKRFGYLYQLAFYRSVLAEAIGLSMPVFFIVIEKREPFRCGVWRVDDDSLSQAAAENRAAIERLIRCEQEDRWESGYEATRSFVA